MEEVYGRLSGLRSESSVCAFFLKMFVSFPVLVTVGVDAWDGRTQGKEVDCICSNSGSCCSLAGISSTQQLSTCLLQMSTPRSSMREDLCKTSTVPLSALWSNIFRLRSIHGAALPVHFHVLSPITLGAAVFHAGLLGLPRAHLTA